MRDILKVKEPVVTQRNRAEVGSKVSSRKLTMIFSPLLKSGTR